MAIINIILSHQLTKQNNTTNLIKFYSTITSSPHQRYDKVTFNTLYSKTKAGRKNFLPANIKIKNCQ